MLWAHIIQIIVSFYPYTLIYDTSFRNVVQPWVELRFNTHWCNWNVFNTFISESIISGGMLLCFMFWIYSLPFTGVLLHHCYYNNGLNQSGWPNQRKHLLKETIRKKTLAEFLRSMKLNPFVCNMMISAISREIQWHASSLIRNTYFPFKK